MIPTDRQPVTKNIFGAIFSYVVHSLTALLITPLISVLFAIVTANWLASWPARDNAFLCVVGMIGMFLGYVASRVTLGSAGCWVWIPGLTWLGFGIWDSVRYFDPRWSQGCSAGQDVINSFFVLDSSRCSGAEGLSGLISTLPAFCSVAYAVGAWAALRVGRQKNTTASVRSI
jgi:hypothetical protein